MTQDGGNVSTTSDTGEALAYTPMHALAARLRAGMSASELLDCYLRRIRRYDAKLHAFVAVYEREARMAAESADRALQSGLPLEAFARHTGADHL